MSETKINKMVIKSAEFFEELLSFLRAFDSVFEDGVFDTVVKILLEPGNEILMF